MMLFRALLIALFFAMPAAAQETFWIEATGHAAVKTADDRTTAKRRALADAMLSAVLAGGAELKGHSALQNGNLTADLTVIRPTGRILQHQIIQESLNNGIWQVKIRAMVGPLAPTSCSGHQQLIVTAYAPRVDVAYRAPAWSVQLAHDVVTDMIDTLDRHPKVALTKRMDRQQSGYYSPVGNDFSYDSLTKGVSQVTPGGHAFSPQIRIDVERDARGKEHLRLDVFLTMEGTEIQTIRREITRYSPLPGKTGLAVLSGRSTKKVKDTLTEGLTNSISEMVNAVTCQAPIAHATLNSGKLTVPLGRENGLSKSSLAFVTDRSDSFAILEISELGARNAVLRPLDRTRSANEFHGLEVTFLETGL